MLFQDMSEHIKSFNIFLIIVGYLREFSFNSAYIGLYLSFKFRHLVICILIINIKGTSKYTF